VPPEEQARAASARSFRARILTFRTVAGSNPNRVPSRVDDSPAARRDSISAF